MMQRKTSLLAAIAIVGLVLPAIGQSQVETFWGNPAGGQFGDSSNWIGSAVPGTEDDATFNIDNNYTVNLDANYAINNLNLNRGGLTLGGTSLTVGQEFEVTADASAALTLANGFQLTADVFTSYAESGINVGIDIGSQATLNADRIVIGKDRSATGTIEVSGTGSEINARSMRLLSYDFEALDGATVNVRSLALSGDDLANRNSNTLVSGMGSQLNTQAEVTLNHAILELRGGAEANVHTLNAREDSTLLASGGSQINVESTIEVEESELIIEGGATVSVLGIENEGEISGTLTVGGRSPRSSSVSVSGAGSELNVFGDRPLTATRPSGLRVYYGDLEVSSGGRVTADQLGLGGRDPFNSGQGDTAGELNVTGTGSSVVVGELEWVLGNVAVADGGTLQANSSVNVNGDLLVSGGGEVGFQSASVSAGNLVEVDSGSFDSALRLDLQNAHLQIFNGGVVTSTNMAVSNSSIEVRNGTLASQESISLVDGSSMLLDGGTIETSNLIRSLDSTIEFVSGTLSIGGGTTDMRDIGETFNSNKRFFTTGQAFIADTLRVTIETSDSFRAGSIQNSGHLVLNTDDITLGGFDRHDGYFGDGILDAGQHEVTIADAGFAQLGQLTTIRGAEIVAPNGVSLGQGSAVVGFGRIDGKVAAGYGSEIHAEGSLILGDIAQRAGFASNGELYVNDFATVIQDADQAQLGTFTQLGSEAEGTLIINNGAILDFGDTVTGWGEVSNLNTEETAIINNGLIAGKSIDEKIELSGYVKGVGRFENVTIDGTFAPGLSPGIVHADNLSFSDSNLLEMELAGLLRGSQHDAIITEGLLELDGTMMVEFLDGFEANQGDSFDLFDFEILTGQFDQLLFPELDAGLRWDTSTLYSNGVLSVSAVPEPGMGGIFALGLVALLTRRRKNGVLGLRVADAKCERA